MKLFLHLKYKPIIMEKRMYHYATVSKALEELKKKGFTVDFNIQESKLINNPNDFEIVHIYRYEGETDPADEATVYGIKSIMGEKGVYVAGLAAYADKSAAMVLNDLAIKERRNPNQI